MANGERKLAISVINVAVSDFLRPVISKGLAKKLSSLRDRIAAGAFLLERNDDPLKRLWFSLAEIHVTAPARRREWVERLDGLREAETKVSRVIIHLQQVAERKRKREMAIDSGKDEA